MKNFYVITFSGLIFLREVKVINRFSKKMKYNSKKLQGSYWNTWFNVSSTTIYWNLFQLIKILIIAREVTKAQILIIMVRFVTPY